MRVKKAELAKRLNLSGPELVRMFGRYRSYDTDRLLLATPPTLPADSPLEVLGSWLEPFRGKYETVVRVRCSCGQELNIKYQFAKTVTSCHRYAHISL